MTVIKKLKKRIYRKSGGIPEHYTSFSRYFTPIGYYFNRKLLAHTEFGRIDSFRLIESPIG